MMTKNKTSRIESLPASWHVLLTIAVIAGLALVIRNPQVPSGFAALSSRVHPDNWARFVGLLLISVALTHWIVFAASILTWRLFELEGSAPRKNLWPPALVGLCESVMYPLAFMTDRSDFIGLWLLLKVAGQWPRWGFPTSNTPNVENLDEGRRRYHRFLIGNALTVMAGFATYVVVRTVALQ